MLPGFLSLEAESTTRREIKNGSRSFCSSPKPKTKRQREQHNSLKKTLSNRTAKFQPRLPVPSLPHNFAFPAPFPNPNLSLASASITHGILGFPSFPLLTTSFQTPLLISPQTPPAAFPPHCSANPCA